jgi:hypothetical protein
MSAAAQKSKKWGGSVELGRALSHFSDSNIEPNRLVNLLSSSLFTFGTPKD